MFTKLTIPGADVPIILITIVSVNAVLFAVLAGWGVHLARFEESPRLRTLARALVVVSTAFVVSAVSRMITVAVSAGWLPGSVERLLRSEWLVAQTLAVTIMGVAGLSVVSKVSGPLRRTEQILTVLSDRLPIDARTENLGFTVRELDVIAVIGSGAMSDKAIAEALYISPSTAGTHIKNIMRKAGVSSRRDLVLLTVRQDET